MPPGEQAPDSWLGGEQLAALASAITGLHRRYYGRGATKARTYQVHPELVLVELRDVYLTVERTLLARGQQNIVRQTRLTFQQAMYNEFVGAVEQITGRKVLAWASEAIAHPELVLEIFYLESLQEQRERLEREAREDAGEIPRPAAGIPEPLASAPPGPRGHPGYSSTVSASPPASGNSSGWRMWASSSSPSTIRGPGREK
jgi:uncharacterized protein YbcI